MNNKFKDTCIKKHTYYFFDHIIDIEIFNSNNIKMDETSFLRTTLDI